MRAHDVPRSSWRSEHGRLWYEARMRCRPIATRWPTCSSCRRRRACSTPRGTSSSAVGSWRAERRRPRDGGVVAARAGKRRAHARAGVPLLASLARSCGKRSFAAIGVGRRTTSLRWCGWRSSLGARWIRPSRISCRLRSCTHAARNEGARPARPARWRSATIGSAYMEFMVRMTEAQMCSRSAAVMAKVGEALATAMRLGREPAATSPRMCGFPPVMARLCAVALEAGIEVDYVRGLVERRRLVPESPPWRSKRGPGLSRSSRWDASRCSETARPSASPARSSASPWRCSRR